MAELPVVLRALVHVRLQMTPEVETLHFCFPPLSISAAADGGGATS